MEKVKSTPFQNMLIWRVDYFKEQSAENFLTSRGLLGLSYLQQAVWIVLENHLDIKDWSLGLH